MVAVSKDTGVEIVDTLRLSITGECNLDCFYCKPLGKNIDLTHPKKTILPSDVSKLMKIIGDLGVRKVRIEGGEPLLRKDAANFVKSSFAHKKVEDVRLITNGTFLKAFADGLRKYGLRKVDINFNSLNFTKFQRITGSDSLYRVLDGIEKVEKLNYTDIRLNILLLDGINNEEIVQFARLTKDRRVHIRFMEYNAVTSQEDPYAVRENRLNIVEAKRMIDNYQALVPVVSLDEESQAPCFNFKNAVGKISFISKQRVTEEREIPRVLFTSEGILINESNPKRSLNLVEDLRKDPKSLKLRKAVEKVLMLNTNKAPLTKTKEAGKKKASKAVATKSAKNAKKPAAKKAPLRNNRTSGTTRRTTARA